MTNMEMKDIKFRAISVEQPIGIFFVGAMSAKDLRSIAIADVRRLRRNEIDKYIGVQRRLSPQRSKDLKKYVTSYDATFPTSIILAVDEKNAEWDEATGIMTIKGTDEIPLIEAAKIIDGQHRVDGLTALKDEIFEVTVSVFVGADIGTQANIFATVNLAQTKVNRSLVYDLLDYENNKSPQKSAHHITVALDQISNSPFLRRIKRLGSATPDRRDETVTQAAVVESLLNLMSSDPMTDRNSFLRKILPKKPSPEEHRQYPFREMFLDKMDTEITKIILHFFLAVEKRWPKSWNDLERKGNVLPKTNGLKALMRYLKPLYLKIADDDRHYIPSVEQFLENLKKVELEDEDFNIKTFPPGSSGESGLYKILMESIKEDDPQKNLF